MNLLQMGAHEAADWLLVRVRATRGRAALYVRHDGQLNTIAGHQARPRPGWCEAGMYAKGLKYREAVDDLAHLAGELRGAL